MKARFSTFLDRVRSSYWFVPAVMPLMAVVLSTVVLSLDLRYADRIPSDAWWLYGGGDEGARVVLSAIVTSMISVTSVVFSITIVALTLAAGQFGSRVLRNFMRDRGNQFTLGTFIATFVYAMLVLRTVRGVEDAEFVPPLAMSVGILLVFVSVGVLIYFIHHVASSIQADSVVRSIAVETEDAIERLFPGAMGEEDPEGDRPETGNPRAASLPTRFDAEAKAVRAARGDHLQIVDHEELMHLAVEHDLVIRLRARPGDFVVPGRIIAHVWKDGDLEPGLLDDVRDVFVLGRSPGTRPHGPGARSRVGAPRHSLGPDVLTPPASRRTPLDPAIPLRQGNACPPTSALPTLRPQSEGVRRGQSRSVLS